MRLRQLPPVAGGQHPRKGAQSLPKEPRRQRCLQPAAIGSFWLPFPAGEVVLLAMWQQIPAVLGQLQPGEQGLKRGVNRPGEWGWWTFREHRDGPKPLL